MKLAISNQWTVHDRISQSSTTRAVIVLASPIITCARSFFACWKGCVVPPLVRDCKLGSRFVTGRDHLFDFQGTQRHGFFTSDPFDFFLRGLDYHGCMESGPGADACVIRHDLLVHFSGGGKTIRRVHAKPSGKRRPILSRRIHSQEPDSRVCFFPGISVGVADGPSHFSFDKFSATNDGRNSGTIHRCCKFDFGVGDFKSRRGKCDTMNHVRNDNGGLPWIAAGISCTWTLCRNRLVLIRGKSGKSNSPLRAGQMQRGQFFLPIFQRSGSSELLEYPCKMLA